MLGSSCLDQRLGQPFYEEAHGPGRVSGIDTPARALYLMTAMTRSRLSHRQEASHMRKFGFTGMLLVAVLAAPALLGAQSAITIEGTL